MAVGRQRALPDLLEQIRKVGAVPRSARNTSVLTKKPIRPSVSARLRLAIGEPTSTSSWPE